MFKSQQTVSVGKYTVQIVSPIGEGGHANIYLAKDCNTGEELVLKKSTPLVQDQMDMAQREVALNRQLKHGNIVEYRGDSILEYRRSGKKVYDVYLLLEYCPGGHLLDFVNNRRNRGHPLTEREVLKYFVQVLRAVDYLHRHKPPVAHRDLKLENVLIANGGRVKLCDFGSCSTTVTRCETKDERIVEEESIEKYTTPYYRAPEMCDLFSGMEISTKVDVWALGCMLYAMAFGKHAFEDGGKLGILNGRFTIPANQYSPKFITLLKWLLTVNPEKRPQVGDVLDFVEEITGMTEGTTTAVSRGSGTGERPKDFCDEGDVDNVASRCGELKLSDSSPEKPRSRKKTSLASITSSMTSKNVEGQGRSRAPSAALQARMARRSSVNSEKRKTSTSSTVSSMSSNSEIFNPFGDDDSTLASQGINNAWDAFDTGTPTTTYNAEPTKQPMIPPQSMQATPILQTPQPQNMEKRPLQTPQQQIMQSFPTTMQGQNMAQTRMMAQGHLMNQTGMGNNHGNLMNQNRMGHNQMYQGNLINQNGMGNYRMQQTNNTAYPNQINPSVIRPSGVQSQMSVPQTISTPQSDSRNRTGSTSSNPFDDLEQFTSTTPTSTVEKPSMVPQFFSNPGLQSNSISGFPMQPPGGNNGEVPLSQQPQFYSNPGLYGR